ncbi:MAG: hypothetical protein R2703_06850 [Micropruina glycogenica]
MNSLVNRFFDARKMMQSLGGQMGGPGMPGMPGARRQPARRAPKPKGRGKGVSGNPAKRASGRPNRRPRRHSEWNPADAFGLKQSGQPSDADLAKALGDFQLPPDLAECSTSRRTRAHDPTLVELVETVWFRGVGCTGSARSILTGSASSAAELTRRPTTRPDGVLHPSPLQRFVPHRSGSRWSSFVRTH